MGAIHSTAEGLDWLLPKGLSVGRLDDKLNPWERASSDSSNHAMKGPRMRMLPSHSVCEGCEGA